MKKIFVACICGLALLFCGFMFQPIVDTEMISANAEAVILDGEASENIASQEADISEEIAVAEASATATECTVKGTLLWKDRSNLTHPLILTKVKIYAVGDILLGEVYTNYEGNYSFIFTNSNNYSRVYIKVSPEGNNSIVKDAYNNIYTYTSDTKSIGNTVIFNTTMTPDSLQGQAFQISQAIIIASKYVEDKGNITLSPVTVIYPHNETLENCFYNGTEETIYILGAGSANTRYSYETWDVIMHEYGHHVGAKLGITNNPGGDHSSGDDLIANYGKDRGCRLAWGEAFATIFSNMAQDYYVNSLSCDNNPILTVADGSYSYYGVPWSYNYEANSLGGEGYEDTIISILWDMYDEFNYEGARPAHDAHSSEEDRFNLGQELWPLLDHAEPNKVINNLSDFVQHITNNNTNTPMVRNLAYLLDMYRINSSDLIFDMSGVTPKLLWTANGGTTSTYANNYFDIVFYNASGEIYYRINGLDFTNTVTSRDQQLSYTLSTEQWGSVLDVTGNTFEAAVLAYQIAYETTEDGGMMGYRTGGYMSVELAVNKPLSEVIHPNINYFEYMIAVSPGDEIIFSFLYPIQGIKMIQTFGGSDTVLELYSESGVLLATDDDSGYANNALISYFTIYNETYRLKVRYKDSTYSAIKLSIVSAKSGITAQPTVIESYETIYAATGTSFANQFVHKPYYMNTMTFTPTVSGTHHFEISGYYSPCIYLIDPRSNVVVAEYGFYTEAQDGAKILSFNVNLQKDVPYLVLFGPLDLTTVTSQGTMLLRINKT